MTATLDALRLTVARLEQGRTWNHAGAGASARPAWAAFPGVEPGRSVPSPAPQAAAAGIGPGAVLRFGVAAIDTHLPAGGLSRTALHELAGIGPDTEHGAAPALLVAGLLARHSG